MNERLCLNVGKPILETRRSDAIYCCDSCENTEKREAADPLEKNYKIMKDIYERGFNDLSKESLKVSGFDFKTYTGIAEIDPVNNTTEHKIFDFFVYIFSINTLLTNSQASTRKYFSWGDNNALMVC